MAIGGQPGGNKSNVTVEDKRSVLEKSLEESALRQKDYELVEKAVPRAIEIQTEIYGFKASQEVGNAPSSLNEKIEQLTTEYKELTEETLKNLNLKEESYNSLNYYFKEVWKKDSEAQKRKKFIDHSSGGEPGSEGRKRQKMINESAR